MRNADKVETMEIDSDGAWIWLKPGFQFDGQHAIHEDSMKQAKALLPCVHPCGCQDCKQILGRK